MKNNSLISELESKPMRTTWCPFSYFPANSSIPAMISTFSHQQLSSMKISTALSTPLRNVFSTIFSFLLLAFLLLVSGLDGWAQTSQVVSATFTSSGSFTPPAGITSVTVQVWGGGGAGGGVTGANATTRTGGGGAGGSFTSATTVAVTPGSPITVTIGAGGTGSSSAGGGVGGTTTFGSPKRMIPANILH